MIWYYPCVTVFECICCYYNDWLYSSLAFSIFPTLKKANNAKAIKSKVNALICRWIQNASNFIILIVSWYLFWSSDYWLKSMKYKKADTKTVFFCEIVRFPPKIFIAGRTQLLISRALCYQISSCAWPAPRTVWWFWRETYYFTIITHFSYQLSYNSWTLAIPLWYWSWYYFWSAGFPLPSRYCLVLTNTQKT